MVARDESASAPEGEEGKSSASSVADLKLRAQHSALTSLYNPKHFELEEDRDSRLRNCRLVDTEAEPRFNEITRLMAEVFKTPVCLITLIIDDRVWFKSKVGPFGSCVDRDGSWCNYIVVPTQPEILITEDASLDARFSHNPYVAGDPFIKFYAGAPLVGVGGRRYGTLCVVDLAARSFTAEMYHLLINFAELAVQEIERDASMLDSWKGQAESDIKANKKLRACLSSATDGVALMDIRSANWRFKYVNEKFAHQYGEPTKAFVGTGLWEKSEPVGMTPLDVSKKVSDGATVNVKMICKTSGKRLWLCLRTACSDQLAPGKPVGVPSWVPSERDGQGRLGIDMDPTTVMEKDPELCQDVEKCFYFAVVVPEFDSMYSDHTSIGSLDHSNAGSMQSSKTGISSGAQSSAGTVSAGSGSIDSGSVQSGGSFSKPLGSANVYGDHSMPEDLAGQVQLGPLVGSGGFGKVYRGLYKERVVAVKMVESTTKKQAEEAESEGLLSVSLNHPNIVKTLLHSTWKQDTQLLSTGEVTKTEEVSVMWILQEYCDRGTLIDAVERGWLSLFRSISAKPDMISMYQTMKDVAEGMAYLHSNNIIHCDLNGRNVMLQWSPTDRRGFTAKISDFGLAQLCMGPTLIPSVFGTVSHMPPELLSDGLLSNKCDVWAFGVLMWEMYTGYRAYQGLKYPTVILKITKGNQLELPDDAPPAFKGIMAACLQFNPDCRPSFVDLLGMIECALDDKVRSTSCD
mmetsp:Transcript_438/g.1315  ORF Transcript_438/g.1315 Transcript_438/m.1315 type:complete len:743 (+) Transcript_438:113-2341(+)|eukprot:CAMPEP_0117661862 /NCGR_PEP_ID=MMETSP0804-20121206/7759_1 /TAXON_ID=1074897 /ORGANISM="Tetraselmis astigmatica, Strain CCMP880" /LENGTH=742 /DNA_ID=CAMNT_0005468749 /DNA_START=103 /DNA_END=2331 /DNA_ORIENTATION=+